MKFSKIAELASDINMSDEDRNRVFRNCKRAYEERKKRRTLSVFLMNIVKS